MPYDEWVKLDLDYVDTWSLRNDARILLRALPAALSSLRV
jgi:lipopolysaccharide/colanic/teichoic acid biosynthesis glycosyltransferase